MLLDGPDNALGGYFMGLDLTDPAKAAARLKLFTRIVTNFAEKRTGDVQGENPRSAARGRCAAPLPVPLPM